MGAFGDAYGKLGNQLFQVGLLYAVNHQRGFHFYQARNGESVWECFDLNIPTEGPECTHRFDEVNGSCNYDPRVFAQPDGTTFHGYFQSYRYFEECRDSLVKFLRFTFAYRARSEATLFALRRRYGRPLASLHVRRGDYVSTGLEDHWGNLARDGYYKRAVDAIGCDVTYLVLSDDIAWCRRHFDLECVEFIDLDHCTSLCLMTGCDVNVVANSSYSWWGAYLNPAAEVYAPSRWFGPAMPPPNDRQDDIVPPFWRTIPAYYGDAPGQTSGD